jgi:hypothetical protein
VADPRETQGIEGGCLCGAIRYRIDGRPGRSTHCHCLHCRRAGGAAFVTWVEFDAAGFRFVSGSPTRYESRPRVTRQFCGRCGAQLTYQHADEPRIVDVTVCSLDDPEIAAPQDHVWYDRVISWVKISDGLPRYKRGRFDG